MEFPAFMNINKLGDEFTGTLPDFPSKTADAEYYNRVKQITNRFKPHLCPQDAEEEWQRLKAN